MSTLRLPMSGRPVTAVLTALAALAMACIPAAAASASGSGPSVDFTPVQVSQAASAWTDGYLCLTNARSSCVSVQRGTAGNAVLGQDPVSRMVVDTNSDGYWEAEFKTYADGNGAFCLASTGLSVGAHASWQHCGANGTVWVLVPHNNGAYLESRYALDRGYLLVLTANGTTPFTQLYVNSPYAPGSIYWQTWTFR
jgi:hypothetical protein